MVRELNDGFDKYKVVVIQNDLQIQICKCEFQKRVIYPTNTDLPQIISNILKCMLGKERQSFPKIFLIWPFPRYSLFKGYILGGGDLQNKLKLFIIVNIIQTKKGSEVFNTI